MQAADDSSWTSYSNTVLVLGESPGVSVDLRLPLTDELRQLMADRGLPHSFAVITAHNPRGLYVSKLENGERHRALLTELHRLQLASWPADGRSPDDQHSEQGVAVALDQSAARELARRLEQSAFFWYDGSCFYVVGALVEAPDLMLPLASQREEGQRAVAYSLDTELNDPGHPDKLPAFRGLVIPKAGRRHQRELHRPEGQCRRWCRAHLPDPQPVDREHRGGARSCTTSAR